MVEKKGLAPEAADKIREFVMIKGDCWSVYNQLAQMPSIQQNARAMKDTRAKMLKRWASMARKPLLLSRSISAPASRACPIRAR